MMKKKKNRLTRCKKYISVRENGLVKRKKKFIFQIFFFASKIDLDISWWNSPGIFLSEPTICWDIFFTAWWNEIFSGLKAYSTSFSVLYQDKIISNRCLNRSFRHLPRVEKHSHSASPRWSFFFNPLGARAEKDLFRHRCETIMYSGFG